MRLILNTLVRKKNELRLDVFHFFEAAQPFASDFFTGPEERMIGKLFMRE